MAWEADYQNYAGSRLFIAPTRPTDNTETLWEGLATWHEITITTMPNVRGRSYNKSTLSVVSSAHDREKKGSYTFPDIDVGVQWLPAEKGQINAQAALVTGTICGFAAVYNDGSVTYFSGQVSNFVEAGGGSNDARTGTLTIIRQSDALDAVTPVIPTEAAT